MSNTNKKVCSVKKFFLYGVLLIGLSIITPSASSYLNLYTYSYFFMILNFLEIVLITLVFLFALKCYFYKIVLNGKNIKSNKLNVIKFFLGPLMLIPQVILGIVVILSIYERPMETGVFDRFLFFQGSIDMGGELLFVATIALYVMFGFLVSWYSVLKLEEVKNEISFLKMLTHLVWVLKYHIAVFVLWGVVSSTDDRCIIPNDFRNMFLWVSLLYILTIILIIFMKKLNISRTLNLIIAPVFMVMWLIIGSDGNTARAKQIPIWGNNPHYVVTSRKHAIMIGWHNLCDDFFGDTKPHYTHQYPQ